MKGRLLLHAWKHSRFPQTDLNIVLREIGYTTLSWRAPVSRLHIPGTCICLSCHTLFTNGMNNIHFLLPTCACCEAQISITDMQNAHMLCILCLNNPELYDDLLLSISRRVPPLPD